VALSPGALPHDTIPGTAWTEADWRIFEAKVRWGFQHGLGVATPGDAIAALGKTFVGTPYRPATLEVPGEEQLVINLRELDCVTFVENVLALTRFIRNDGIRALANPPAAREQYEGYLRQLRYRRGVINGYPSRLHYFSEWLAVNAANRRLRIITRDLGGEADREPLGFMSSNPGAYRQMADASVATAIRDMEQALNARPERYFIPEGRIAAVAPGIKDGDLIAATSTLAGLDVAHTGFALWQGNKLHLLHAPLVGSAVEISEVPLADRIQSIKTQDGIMVARPLP